MSQIRDGLRRATHIFEAAAWHRAVLVTCSRCTHSATFNPHGLWWRWRLAVQLSSSCGNNLRWGQYGIYLETVRERLKTKITLIDKAPSVARGELP